jgi:hypothetical protein
VAAADEPGRATSEAELEGWAREELGLDAAAEIRVAERPGTDPRCSPVVTEVAISAPGETPYSFHIERPLAELTRMDLVAALAFGGGH